MKTLEKKGVRIFVKALLVGLVTVVITSATPPKSVLTHTVTPTIPNPRLVTICHFGYTIRVDQRSVQYHMAHGDHVGSCVASPE